MKCIVYEATKKKRATSLNRLPSNMFLFLFQCFHCNWLNKREKNYAILGNLPKGSNFYKFIIDQSSLFP